MKYAASVLALSLALLSAACTPIGAGLAVGSAAGVSSAREGGIQASLEDAKISATIHDLWLKKDFEMFTKVGMTVDQGRVLLTGIVQKPQHRVEAVRLAWQAEGVKQVINEIKVANSEGIKGWARDVWITSRLKASLLFDKNIQSVNYSIDTVQSVVYLMGVAQNQGELNNVMSYARTVPYVKQVVSYVKLAGQPLNQVVQNGPANTMPITSDRSMGTMPVNTNAPRSPGPVTAMPLGTTTTTTTTVSRTAVPANNLYADPLNVPMPPMDNVPMPPRSGVAAPGRPAPIVDQGF